MKPIDIYGIKVVLVAIFLVVLVDVSLFLLATNSFIPYIIFLSGSSAFNIIIFIMISFLMNRYRKTKQTPS